MLAGVVLTGALVTAAATMQPSRRQRRLLRRRTGARGQGRGGGRGCAQVPGPIEKVADNLYMIPGAGGNSGVFITANGVVLVDTKNPNNGQLILDQIKTVTDKPITHIINTHTHGDHNGSNIFFPATVEVVTHENTAGQHEEDAGRSRTPPTSTACPIARSSDRLTLLSGNDAIDLYYFGAAHTNGDAIVVFRNARVAHTGDMFASKGQSAHRSATTAAVAWNTARPSARPRPASRTSTASSPATPRCFRGRTS